MFDNTEGKAPGEFVKFNEISVKRRVSREGQSEYFLNGSKCRRRDITDLFLGTGLGSRSYAIIEQGMISRLIEAKPEELRVYIEEAAGISKYKERRRETENRIKRTQENLDRLDLHATLKQADAAATEQWWDGEAFDRILLDVPCSASGVIRRHPDIKLLRRESDITPLAAIQLGLLDAMWAILKPGGRLVYATCSVFPQENHRIIQRFCKQQTDAILVEPEAQWGRDMGAGRQLLPDPDSHDGFFYAVLEKPEP